MIQPPEERWAQIDALFGEALQLPAVERLAFLGSACGGDRELFDAVRSLMDSETAAGRFIGEEVGDFAGDVVASLAGGDPDMVGAMAGPYRLVRELGRGGMGTVYLAERADGEFDKRVALLYAESVAAARRLLGQGHPALAVALSNHADLLVRRADYARAGALQREALDTNRTAFGPAHMNVGIVTGRLADTLCRQGRDAEGAAMFADALAILRGALPPGHSRIPDAEQQAARCAA